MPTSAREIAARINQITFNQPMLRDIEVIETVRALQHAAGRGAASPADARLARHRFHLIEAGRFTSALAPESKGKPDIELLTYLHGAGRSETEKWLARSRAASAGAAPSTSAGTFWRERADAAGGQERAAARRRKRQPERRVAHTRVDCARVLNAAHLRVVAKVCCTLARIALASSAKSGVGGKIFAKDARGRRPRDDCWLGIFGGSKPGERSSFDGPWRASRAPLRPKWTAAAVLLAMLAATAILSQFFRASTSVIGPELIRDLSLSSEAFGFANGSFFLALLLAQIPVGIAFDRFGPRMTVAVLSVPMAAGAMLHGAGRHRARSWRWPASSSASAAPAASWPASC